VQGDSGGFENKALSKLGQMLGMPAKPGAEQPAADERADPPAASGARPAPPPDAPPVAGVPVVRRERKQRGGKTVTVVARLELGAEELKALAREMAKALGCGARVEGEDVVIQGDQVERTAAWLERRGARRVVRGN
jgi:translation initiation factor 1